MSTRSSIIVKLSNDTYKRIYCHWDGYIAHNGKILFNYYNSQELAESLVKLGDLSSLGKSANIPEGYTVADEKIKGICQPYGESVTDSESLYNSLNEATLNLAPWIEYLYYWNGTKWEYKKFGYSGEYRNVAYRDLQEAVESIKEEDQGLVNTSDVY